jgi:hypothetical protein
MGIEGPADEAEFPRFSFYLSISIAIKHVVATKPRPAEPDGARMRWSVAVRRAGA